jgi:16S rRNA (adenine1518-N6/adenine1519-N6)-dimethyltransferase
MPEEYLDVVDENDRVIGKDLRSRIHSDGRWHRGVHILLSNIEGRILVQKRSMKKDKFPGAWDYSVSGHVDSGKEYDETAKRELEEELGIRGARPQRIAKFRMNYGPNDNMITVLYGANWGGGLQNVDESEIAEVTWLTKDELKGLLKREYAAKWFKEEMNWLLGGKTEAVILEKY